MLGEPCETSRYPELVLVQHWSMIYGTSQECVLVAWKRGVWRQHCGISRTSARRSWFCSKPPAGCWRVDGASRCGTACASCSHCVYHMAARQTVQHGSLVVIWPAQCLQLAVQLISRLCGDIPGVMVYVSQWGLCSGICVHSMPGHAILCTLSSSVSF